MNITPRIVRTCEHVTIRLILIATWNHTPEAALEQAAVMKEAAVSTRPPVHIRKADRR
jgi:hypothetical protein